MLLAENRLNNPRIQSFLDEQVATQGGGATNSPELAKASAYLGMGPLEANPVFEGCVHAWFEQQVGRTPDAWAVVAQGESLTYTQLNRRANRLAHYLLAAGVRPGVLVGICMERSLDMIVAVLGVLKAGGAYVPLDPTYPKDRTLFMVEHAGIPVLVTRAGLADSLPQDGIRTVAVDSVSAEIARQPDTNPASGVRPEDRIYAIYTSGSTGRPKLSGVSHRGFANLLNWFTGEFQLTAADRTLLVSSFNFDLTQKNIYAPLISGGELHLQASSAYEPARIRESVENHRITLINCTPSAFNPLLAEGEAAFRQLRSLRLVFLGGEPISLPALRSWVCSPYCHAEFANTYGPTECTDICVFHRLGRAEVLKDATVPIGKPIWNVDVYVLGNHLEALPPGEVGELCVGGRGVGEGYINNPSLTAAKFLADPFSSQPGARLYKTGDLACYLPDGTIQFRGRIDNQVKIRGFRIELEEIERVLAGHPGVHQAAVAARHGNAGESATAPSPAADPQLTAYVVPNAGQPPRSHELREFLSRTLPEYMIPSGFVRMTGLPLSGNGKVDRAALPAPTRENALDTIHYRAPESPIEIQVASMLSHLLVLDRMGLEDNFFLLGLHSLLSAMLIVRLRERFGVQFTLRDLFETQTVAKLAERVERELVASLEKMSDEEATRILSHRERA